MAGVVTAPGTAQFTIDVHTAEGRTDAAMSGSVQFVKTDGTIVSAAQHVGFSTSRTFLLPPWPTIAALRCDVTLAGCRAQTSQFFEPRADKPTAVTLTAMRDPASWVPGFTAFDTLSPDRFARFFDVARKSSDVTFKLGEPIGALTAKYDVLSGGQALASKMALLNLYAVLSDEIDPILRRPWFASVREIVMIDPERFVAEVDDDLVNSVRDILTRLTDFSPMGFFTELSPGLHHDNFRLDRYDLTGPLMTVKSRYEQGNVQLTVATGTEKKTGRSVCLLDADMDEHSQLLLHTGDLFVHPFTGGTQPVDMHEYIVAHSAGMQDDGIATIDLGYQLVRRP